MGPRAGPGCGPLEEIQEDGVPASGSDLIGDITDMNRHPGIGEGSVGQGRQGPSAPLDDRAMQLGHDDLRARRQDVERRAERAAHAKASGENARLGSNEATRTETSQRFLRRVSTGVHQDATVLGDEEITLAALSQLHHAIRGLRPLQHLPLFCHTLPSWPQRACRPWEGQDARESRTVRYPHWMDETLSDLLELLDLEPIEVNLFRGVSPQTGWQRVFGGQVLGQALMAALRTVEDRPVHSLHGYFLRPGDPKIPILYDVDRIRDGKSFTTRRVVAIQHGRAIFNMAASFQVPEEGLEHQEPSRRFRLRRPSRARRNCDERSRTRFGRNGGSTFCARKRSTCGRSSRSMSSNPRKRRPGTGVWFRAIGELPDDPALHSCLMLYASDMTLLDTSVRPHGIPWTDPRFQSASLDHSMWFHRPFRADEMAALRHGQP